MTYTIEAVCSVGKTRLSACYSLIKLTANHGHSLLASVLFHTSTHLPLASKSTFHFARHLFDLNLDGEEETCDNRDPAWRLLAEPLQHIR